MNGVLISRSALWTYIMMLPHNGDIISSDEVEQAITDAPSVDAEPVRHGYWKPVMLKDVFGRDFVYRHACSICH